MCIYRLSCLSSIYLSVYYLCWLVLGMPHDQPKPDRQYMFIPFPLDHQHAYTVYSHDLSSPVPSSDVMTCFAPGRGSQDAQLQPGPPQGHPALLRLLLPLAAFQLTGRAEVTAKASVAVETSLGLPEARPLVPQLRCFTDAPSHLFTSVHWSDALVIFTTKMEQFFFRLSRVNSLSQRQAVAKIDV